ncbi:hypothetical protein NC653_010027 [Populus alba x Populus x berolinensis]|uniref:Uncharacterized protein n=1 Tax=Populus alba x Populus x berolinensis TaxID=444605 RepID=A0AAD6RAP1_9ROSI|nr:hypothetical protein NC653_010027 [Populus alba x Populus x berolinensis]
MINIFPCSLFDQVVAQKVKEAEIPPNQDFLFSWCSMMGITEKLPKDTSILCVARLVRAAMIEEYTFTLNSESQEVSMKYQSALEIKKQGGNIHEVLLVKWSEHWFSMMRTLDKMPEEIDTTGDKWKMSNQMAKGKLWANSIKEDVLSKIGTDTIQQKSSRRPSSMSSLPVKEEIDGGQKFLRLKIACNMKSFVSRASKVICVQFQSYENKLARGRPIRVLARKLLEKMIRDGDIASQRKPRARQSVWVIHSSLTETKLMEVRRALGHDAMEH